MKALIYIDLFDEIEYQYDKEIISWLRAEYSDIMTLDLDNYSDSMMMDYAIRIIEGSEKFILIINAAEQANAGRMIGFFEKLLRFKNKGMVMLKGSNQLAERMFSLMKDDFLKENDTEKAKSLIKDFLTQTTE